MTLKQVVVNEATKYFDASVSTRDGIPCSHGNTTTRIKYIVRTEVRRFLSAEAKEAIAGIVGEHISDELRRQIASAVVDSLTAK